MPPSLLRRDSWPYSDTSSFESTRKSVELTTKAIAIIVVCSIVGTILLAAIACCCVYKRRSNLKQRTADMNKQIQANYDARMREINGNHTPSHGYGVGGNSNFGAGNGGVSDVPPAYVPSSPGGHTGHHGGSDHGHSVGGGDLGGHSGGNAGSHV